MIKKIYNQNYNSILKNINFYIEKFLLDGILFFDNLNIDKQSEWDIFCRIGDKLGFFPNSSSGPLPMLPFSGLNEDHKGTFYRHKEKISKDSIFIEWHLENLHKSSPQVAALWNMTKFECQPDCGTTGFANMANIYNMFPKNIKEYLDNLEIILTFDTDINGQLIINSSKKITKAVVNHYYTNEKILRIPLYLDEYNVPSEFLGKELIYVQNFINDNIVNGNSYVDWINWSQNDVVIVDLFLMAHAVKGGFNIGERIFSRIWAYNNIEHMVL